MGCYATVGVVSLSFFLSSSGGSISHTFAVDMFRPGPVSFPRSLSCNRPPAPFFLARSALLSVLLRVPYVQVKHHAHCFVFPLPPAFPATTSLPVLAPYPCARLTRVLEKVHSFSPFADTRV
ncbi:hypothetical protein C8R47DRAFT_1151612 [Mycena vitilis]|nr:hypothetical protein C8R47DRAFT_1151612 [Mycena vitilis]